MKKRADGYFTKEEQKEFGDELEEMKREACDYPFNAIVEHILAK